MRTRVDTVLVREAERYKLRFTCEDCSNFDAERLACGNGYPTAPHRAVDLRSVQSLEFCKDFELG